LDRDINALENILEQGLIIYFGCGTQSKAKEKRPQSKEKHKILEKRECALLARLKEKYEK